MDGRSLYCNGTAWRLIIPRRPIWRRFVGRGFGDHALLAADARTQDVDTMALRLFPRIPSNPWSGNERAVVVSLPFREHRPFFQGAGLSDAFSPWRMPPPDHGPLAVDDEQAPPVEVGHDDLDNLQGRGTCRVGGPLFPPDESGQPGRGHDRVVYPLDLARAAPRFPRYARPRVRRFRQFLAPRDSDERSQHHGSTSSAASRTPRSSTSRC